ncbi:LADA_0B09186g1_1 [Lachancea dasiensis]|uniref:LADA_0B09186g1_1 n=1 Tax=Lachancea dasiensis TaxID=1072105 RepID=A0A1G4IUN6_9SACH|nr:LADA_0B09186g1_1 [Lachancea dasiensis]
MSDSEEFLTASRQRRSNAGSKMQKLIDQERQELQERTANLDDDEINLLFQEEEGDEEFKADTKRRKDEDDVFSESDEESDGEEDDEAGERELEQQERKRRKQQKKHTIPVVKKRATSTDMVSKPLYEQPKAESLLLDNRRTSKRSSVVANKLQIYEKLSLAEKKREKIQNRLRQTKAKMAFVELTQEDRLRQAEETELINTQSLTRFREEEIYKKETRAAMNLRRKVKFAAGEIMLRVNTTGWKVTPAMEVADREYWELQLSKRHKKKKKYTRRKKNKDNAKGEENSGIATPGVEIIKPESTGPSANPIQDDKPVDTQSDVSIKKPTVEDRRAASTGPDVPGIPDVQSPKRSAQDSMDDHNAENSSTGIIEESRELGTEKPFKESNHGIKHSVLQVYPKKDQTGYEEATDKDDNVTSGVTEENISAENPELSKPELNPKQVSFAAENEVSTFDHSLPPNTPLSKEPSAEPEYSRQDSEDLMDEVDGETDASEIYEGPEQLVGRNFVTVYTFPEENPKVHDIRPYIFGEQWAQPLNSRSEDVETIAKITNKQVGDEWLDLSASLIPDTSIFETFPGFGEYDKKVSTEVAEETDTKLKLELKTPAPTGVILPNGVRKKCLITNRECQYFDPKNGVPYADVDAYKTVQELQDPIGEGGSEEDPRPRFKWFGFARGGIFLDMKRLPAKGVPVGF